MTLLIIYLSSISISLIFVTLYSLLDVKRKETFISQDYIHELYCMCLCPFVNSILIIFYVFRTFCEVTLLISNWLKSLAKWILSQPSNKVDSPT